MTFVGKVLVVVQVVLSLCFMAFAGAVYSVQSSWRDQARKTDDAFQNARTQWNDEQKDFKDQIARLTTERDQSKVDADTARATAETRAQTLQQRERELETLKTELEKERALAQIAATEATMRREEAHRQREENVKLHQSRDLLITQLRKIEDALFGAEVEKKTYTERHQRVLEELFNMRTMVAQLGLSTDPKDYAGRQTPPPDVTALVMNTRKDPRNGTEFVEISIGSDDGLFKGHDVHVYRNNGRPQYLGKINIVLVTPDRAVGTVVERARNGVIQKGDNVTTKL